MITLSIRRLLLLAGPYAGHKIIQGVDVISKMEAGTGMHMDRTLQKFCCKWLQKNDPGGEGLWYFDIFYGARPGKGQEKIARYIFDNRLCPMLRVRMDRRQYNQIETIRFLHRNGLVDSSGILSPMRSTVSAGRWVRHRVWPRPGDGPGTGAQGGGICPGFRARGNIARSEDGQPCCRGAL